MKKYFKYIIVFLFFVIIFFLSPISGDDWGNYLVGSEGIRHSLGVAVGMYFDWEGRIISRVLINILTYYKWLWNVVNSFVVVGSIYMGYKWIGKKPKRIIFPLVCLIILSMNLFTFSQVMTWIAGNITYLFVVPIILWYFYFIFYNDKYNKWFVFINSLINLFGCMFVENMALVLVVGNILLLVIKYIKNKKIDKRIILYLGLSIIGSLSMLLSPGTRYRNSIENIEFNKLNIFEKVIHNIPNFIYYTFIVNSFMLILMSFSNYFIIRDKVKNKWVKYLLIISMFLSILTIFIYPVSLFKEISLGGLINQNNILVILYWLIYLVMSFILIFIYDKKDLSNIFLFLVGLSSNGVMLISPTWGFRTSFFTYLMLSIVALKIINNYVNEKSVYKYLVNTCLVVLCSFYLLFYINIYKCLVNVRKQVESNDEVIYIDAYSRFAPCNINPSNSYHLEKFKLYYGIDEDKKLVLRFDKWKYEFIYKG